MPIKSLIRTIPNYPKKGVMFRDITTLLADPQGFRLSVNKMVQRYTGIKIDKVAGIEARGFIFGAPLAHQLSVGFVPIRKKGKLPAATVSHTYELEYGTDVLEMHTDAIKEGELVLLVDDLLATGGGSDGSAETSSGNTAAPMKSAVDGKLEPPEGEDLDDWVPDGWDGD